jgi:hypothetical protein
VTPELLEYAKRERGFTPQQTEFVMKKLVLEYSDGMVRRNWPEIGQKWILTEKVDSTEQGRKSYRFIRIKTAILDESNASLHGSGSLQGRRNFRAGSI